MRRSSSAHRMAFDRWNQGPALRTGIAGHHAAAVGALEPIHGLQPRNEQRVALSKRPNRLFDIVRRNAHALKITELRSKTVAPAVHKSARWPLPSEPKAARRILLARPPPAVKTRRMSRIAKGHYADPLFKTNARADSQRRGSRSPELAGPKPGSSQEIYARPN